MSDDALRSLAEQAGISLRWTDYRGELREVAPDTLRALLAALDLPAGSAAQIAESQAMLTADNDAATLPPLLTATAGGSLRIAAGEIGAGSTRTLLCEDGHRASLHFEDRGDGQLQAQLPEAIGYHRLQLDDREITIAAAPLRAFGVADALAARGGSPRIWGIAAQLYALRRSGDGGVGDFGALAEFARLAAGHGADALAISPVHALFAADPDRYGPYAPSSRLFINAMHADPAALLGDAESRRLIAELGLQAEWQRLQEEPLIDWPAAARARMQLLRASYAQLSPQLDGDGERARAFAAFVDDGGEALRDHACFEALHARQFAAGRWSWHDWPAELRDPRSPAVAAFADAHREDLRFHLFAQWLAAKGLGDAQRAAREAGMAVGLIGDLAVGTDGGGSHAWSRQREMLGKLSVGAPPDLLNALGQSWGLTAFSPRAMRRGGYAAFIETLRAALRQVGGLRIDHVLGLQRLWLVPPGAHATEGAYLRYPLDDLLRLIALESVRHRALIVGEDLGTVPDGFRERLYGAGILGMRVLWFERDHGLFVEPSRWPVEAMATTSTHDLPSSRGWWQGRDIDWRAQLQLFAPHSGEQQDRDERALDRRTLWAAYRHAGVVRQHEAPPADQAEAAVDAALQYVASTPSQLAIAPIEDLLGLLEQPNLPGTVAEHPNWQRRLPAPAADLFQQPEVQARLARLAAERPRGS